MTNHNEILLPPADSSLPSVGVLTAATALTVCLLATSNAQEIVNEKEYGKYDLLGDDHDFPRCNVETEVDLFTDEETHKIGCISDELANPSVSSTAAISSNEDDSQMMIDVYEPGTTIEIEENECFLIRIDQNPPEEINPDRIAYGYGWIEKSNSIKNFLTKVKNGQQRLVVRIGAKRNSVREMPLQNGNVSAAIEDFLNRTENLPAFRIQD